MIKPTKSLAADLTTLLLLLCALTLAGALAWSVSDGLVVTAILVGCGLAAVIVMSGAISLTPEDTRAESTERTLRVATNTLGHLRGGLTVENARAICALLLPETSAAGIAITDTQTVLAYEGALETPFMPGTLNAKPTREVLESRRMETFVSVDQESQDVRRFSIGNRRPGHAFGIIVPLLVQDRAVGTIKLYYRRDLDIDRTQLAIAEGLGTLLSTQLSSLELDRQAELAARAEIKALQAQINPHFLFNTLNTIASFTRTNPTKARDLLREFSAFYRSTLESSEKTLISLSQELEQTRRYLKIEKARFGENRIVESEHMEPGCEDLPVPSFLVQPIVENAVRHAMRDEGALHVDVQVATDGDDILIAVADDGLGMDKDVADRLLAEATEQHEQSGGGSRGTGMALRNVADRIERFYGQGSGVEIVSKPGEGTCVTLRLANARERLASAPRA
ncbi:GAF domain-containing sensor histidine kinase [Thermophilibacter provencensis]|uniref:histidine kinase n=1 Tax=Thermophilibacter provencensis TaxID=1852386 RepID=A0ABT7V2P6_9ACTN|nr:histidine kinase [Thermophilibacter provencensis]MDM8270872.1 histidine kinase [Thermophilibacter provencensis]